MFKADGERREFPLTKSRTVVGRNRSCDLRIPLSSVSREHCEILVEATGVTVRDLDSSNGTYLNHNRVERTPAEAGDELAVGPVVFTLVIDGEPSRIKPVPSLLESRNARNGTGAGATAAPLAAAVNHSAAAGARHDSADDSGEAQIDLEDPVSALEGLEDDSGELPLLSDEDDENDKPSS